MVPDATPVATMPPTTAPAVVKYKGCFSRLHRTHGTYSIYCPVGWVASMPSASGFFGAFGAAETVTPPPPPGTVKVADEPTQPPETVPAGTEDTKTPFYKQPLFWVAAIGGVVVVGGGSYMLFRRRKY